MVKYKDNNSIYLKNFFNSKIHPNFLVNVFSFLYKIKILEPPHIVLLKTPINKQQKHGEQFFISSGVTLGESQVVHHCAPREVSPYLLSGPGLWSQPSSLVCEGQVFTFPECVGMYEGEGCSSGAVTKVQGCSLITQACFYWVTLPA